MRHQLTHFLTHIPQSNEDALPLTAFIKDEHRNQEAVTFEAVAHLLATLGLVEFDETTGMIRATSQTAKYALNSLAEYVKADLKIVEDWKTRGVLRNPDEGALQNGASFLHLLEAQRLAIQSNAPATRTEKVGQVIIKRTNPTTGDPELLFQYDKNANQYQLIGGRWRESDGDILNTMVREIEEELEGNDLVYEQDYQLKLITGDFVPPSVLSPTFGALTQYHFWVYHMVGLTRPLTLQTNDQWVPISQMLGGTVIDPSGAHYPFQNMHIYYAMNEAIEGGLINLPDSWANESGNKK